MLLAWGAMVCASVRATVRAHHSVLDFAGDRGTTLSGTVAEVRWANPHTYIAMDVKDGPEQGRRWVVESEAAAVLERLGWTRGSVRRGDRLVVVGARHRDGDRILRCQRLMPARGAPLPCYPERTQ